MWPILKYPGAKWRLAPWLLEHMPPHESYLEPYFGSGALFFAKDPARIETINDLDGEVVNFFRACREQPEALAEAIYLTPYARAEFAAAYEDTPSRDDVERARRFAVRCWMAFGASVRSTGWRQSTGAKPNGGPDNPKLWRRVPEQVWLAAERLRDAQIESRPALDVIRRCNGPQVLIYADPPYLRETRTAHGDQYTHEMRDDDHIELLNALNRHSGMVMLSGYDSGLYRSMLEGWECYTTKAQAELGATRTECLWLNPAAYAAVERPLWQLARGIV